MKIFPAIDLRGGRVVRLTEGDYDRMTVYGDDPVQVAGGFLAAGAEFLHVVDLDAAKDGVQVNLKVIGQLARVGLRMEVGGGGRDDQSIKRYLDAGVERVIIGSAAITTPGFLERMAKAHPGRIAAGVDAKGGMVAIHGWREVTDVDAFEFLKSLPTLGVDTAIYTDISRDGMMMGANIDAYRATKQIEGLNVIASGGVSAEADIIALKELKLYGAIIGRALYTGAIDLKKALQLAAEGEK